MCYLSICVATENQKLTIQKKKNIRFDEIALDVIK